MATKEFTLNEGVEAFNLTYSTIVSKVKQHFWNINGLLETKNFVPTRDGHHNYIRHKYSYYIDGTWPHTISET